MIRERVTVDNFKKIAKENEYFLWHFLMEEQYDTKLALWSIFDEKFNSNTKKPMINQLGVLLSMTDIPYYESYVKDSVDFLMNLGLTGHDVFKLRNENPLPDTTPNRKWYYVPLVIGFKRTRMVYGTNRVCYCVEGVTEIIMNLNPELLSNIE